MCSYCSSNESLAEAEVSAVDQLGLRISTNMVDCTSSTWDKGKYVGLISRCAVARNAAFNSFVYLQLLRSGMRSSLSLFTQPLLRREENVPCETTTINRLVPGLLYVDVYHGLNC